MAMIPSPPIVDDLFPCEPIESLSHSGRHVIPEAIDAAFCKRVQAVRGPTVVPFLFVLAPSRDALGHLTPPLLLGRELCPLPGDPILVQCPSQSSLPPCQSTAPRQYRDPGRKFAAVVRLYLSSVHGYRRLFHLRSWLCALRPLSYGPPCQRLPKLISGPLRHYSPHSPIRRSI
jgi:hypothetical protein